MKEVKFYSASKKSAFTKLNWIPLLKILGRKEIMIHSKIPLLSILKEETPEWETPEEKEGWEEDFPKEEVPEEEMLEEEEIPEEEIPEEEPEKEEMW